MFRISAITDQASMDFEFALKYISDLGINTMEIHALWDKNIEELTDDEAAKAEELVNRYGMTVSNISSTLFLCCPISGEDKKFGPIDDYFITIDGNYKFHMEMLERCIRLADEFKTEYIRFFPFIEDAEIPEKEMVKTVVNVLREPVEKAKQAGKTILLENCPHTYLFSGAMVSEAIEMGGFTNLKSLWDPGNTYRAGGNPFPEDYEKVAPHIAHIHFKDVTEEKEMVPLGEGTLDYKAIVKRLIDDGYNGTVSLEPEFVDPEKGRPEGLKRAFEGLQKIIKEAS